MSGKPFQATLILVVCAAMAAAAAVTPRASLAQSPGQNLLIDGDFETSPWVQQDGIGEVLIAPGWRAWWVDVAPSYVRKPSNCNESNKPECYWMRPQFQEMDASAFPNRVHDGFRAQKYYSQGRMHQAGLYQRVTGITTGTTLRFSIYMQAWQCAYIDACGKGGIRSDQPYAMHLKVGIDPYGGTDPFSSNVVWSPEREAFDQWVEFAVQAKAQSEALTVFTHSRAEFDWARQSNDVYVDDASLLAVSGQTVTPGGQPGATAAATLPAGTRGPTSTPLPPPTPRGEGAVVHVVQSGDTLSGISSAYGVSLDDLYKLNNLTRDSILNVGQEIVVKAGPGGAVAPQPTVTLKATVAPTLAPKTTGTPAATPSPSPLATQTLPPPPTATPVPGGLCMSAFEDANGNTVRDGNEPGLAGVTFVILSSGAQVARYATDGSTQPYCLTTLPPGAYSVQVALPSGYVSAFDKADVALALGQQIDLAVAARQGEPSTPTVAPTVPAQATPPASAFTNTALAAVVLFGVAFLILIIAAIMIIRRGR
jgi:LysM repeat protein